MNIPLCSSDTSIPAGFAPFGLQAINGNIYVSYAKQNDEKEDDVAGPGLGFVNVFDPNGKLISFAAGIADEAHGLYGRIDAAGNDNGSSGAGGAGSAY